MMTKRPSRPLPPSVPMPPKKSLPVKPKPEVVRGEVSSVTKIFAAFFRLCKERLPKMIAVLLLSVTASLLLLAALGLGGLSVLGLDISQAQQFFLGDGLTKAFADPQTALGHLPLLGAGAAMLLAVALLWSWCYTAMLAAAVDEHHGIIESLCTGWKYLFPMLWIGTLFAGVFICWLIIVSLLIPVSLMVLAPVLSAVMPAVDLQHLGLMNGSVLFVGIGIVVGLMFLLILSVVPLSMSLCAFVMMDEGHTNIDALLISRLYVRGHWWDTLFKIFLIGLIIDVPLIFLPFVVPVFQNQLAVQAASFVIQPFMLLYMLAIYRDLKKAAGRVDPDSSWRCLWRLMAAAGILLPLLGVIGAALTGGPKVFSRLSPQNAAKNSVPPADGPSLAEAVNAPQVRTVPAVDSLVIWRDPAGDTSNPLLDIREVSALGRQGELTLTVTLAKPLAEYFAAKDREEYAPLVSFFFDIDQNEATGAALPGKTERTGYDFELNVLLAVPPDAPEKGRAYPSLYAVGPQKRQSLAPLADSAAVLADSSLTIRLPYERLDSAAGGRLRVCFREAAQKEGGTSGDQTVPLK